MPFQTQIQVRFAHVDPAGIVFYPRYFEMLNGAVEDWFADDLGMDFRAMHRDHGIGVPTVKLDVAFRAASELGEMLAITITPREIGRSSCAIDVVFSADGAERLHAGVVLVCMDLNARRSTPWPTEIAERIGRHLAMPQPA